VIHSTRKLAQEKTRPPDGSPCGEPTGTRVRLLIRSDVGETQAAWRRASLSSSIVAPDEPDYFSDSELGPQPLVLDELPPAAWAGISATFHRFADRHYFAAEFPEQCPDGRGVAGTSMAGLRAMLVAHVPSLGGWPREEEPPSTVTAMDLAVFAWQHAQEPEARSHHDYFDHDHLVFDQRAGRDRWRRELNRILERNGVALRQEVDGRVVRVGTVAVGTVRRTPIPPTGDVQLDDKIAIALRKYESPDIVVRRESLEALWDAFERIKTVLDPSDKKRSSESLVDLIATGAAAREVVSDEFSALTRHGNEFQIRHHEVTRHVVEAPIVDLLFVRALALVEGAARALAARASA